jgi:uncharacterized protein (TIGR03435 family)
VRIRDLTLFAISGFTAFAQTQEPRIAFENASIRARQSTSEGSRGPKDQVEFSGNRLTARNATLNTCLEAAYRLSSKQFTTPGDSGSWRYDIDAVAPADATKDEIRLMLRTLLRERLQMKQHMEIREIPVDALTLGKKAHKMQESTTEGEAEFNAGRYQRIPMWEFAWSWSNLLMTPVVDMTGLKGRYDFSLDIRPYLNHDTGRAAAFRAAVSDQLGLRVETRKAPVEFLVVDQVERNPTEK